MKYIFNCFVYLLFATFSAMAQCSKTHYIPPVACSNDPLQAPQEHYLYISCPSISPINFKIYNLGGAIISGQVSRDQPYVYDIGFGSNTQFIIDRSKVGTVLNNKGFIVEAEDLVYVNLRVTASSDHFQAGSIVSKGLAALGTQFRIGGFINTGVANTTNAHYTFATILATEDNTIVSFSDIKAGAVLINNAAAGNTPPPITLNSGQSYAIAVQGPTVANADALIGAAITSNKPIAVNCGSFEGSNGNTSNLDIGMDQIVSSERTGTEYIFIKGNGLDVTERPLIISNENGTDVFLNGNTTAFTTLNAGEYLALSGTDFSAQGNLYVTTSKKAFAYQGIGGKPEQPNQNMHFVPPISCQTPKIISNIPLINSVGDDPSFTATICIVTEAGASLNFIKGRNNFTLASLPIGITATGPLAIIGNPNFVTYKLEGVTGNVSVFSTKQVYLSYYGSSNAATYGGFFSGFTFKPEVTFGQVSTNTLGNCIPNISLSLNPILAFDSFQWYQNGIAIAGETSNSYVPTQPGNYQVYGQITGCPLDASVTISDEIPVSDCPADNDRDGINNNIDLDLDNDGLTNCSESLGIIQIPLANIAGDTFSISNYSNSFTGILTPKEVSAPAVANPFVGQANGSFVTEVPSGKNNAITYDMTFAQPVSLEMDYVINAAATDLLNSNGSFVLKCPINNTITVLNPSNQLLIDTNYDGNYETGITQFSSFEIRFRFNGLTPLAVGAGTFSFRTNLTNSLSITHSNLSETANNKATFSFQATCIPKDTDGDGIADQVDIDSDNDGILDLDEATGTHYIVSSTTDANQDGIYDEFATGLTPIDSDNDGIRDYLDLDSDNDGILDTVEALGGVYTAPATTDVNQDGLYDDYGNGSIAIDTDADGIKDYLDLDSDNDGIFDIVESGSNALDINLNGVIDGLPISFGQNGLSNSVETLPDSGILSYTLLNTDANLNNGDNIPNYIDLDSDADACADVIEAGFLDPDGDQMLGSVVPPTINSAGVVNSGVGYIFPNANYIINASIIITTQPESKITGCVGHKLIIAAETSVVDAYQWQISTDNGTTWSNITNNSVYSGATTASLIIIPVSLAMNGNLYRLDLFKIGNSCGLVSNEAKVTVYAVPVINSPITLKQCDDDTDGISSFNLLATNSNISANAAVETFTYFTDLISADNDDSLFQINSPTTYLSNNGIVGVRVTNSDGCYSVAQLNIVVSATQIPATKHWDFWKCDDYIDVVNNDRDGITLFDFSAANVDIKTNYLSNPSLYNLKYYRNITDALAFNNPIADITAYRNIGFPNSEQVIGRIDSILDNACYGFAKINLTVEALPVINNVGTNFLIRHCDDDQDGSFGFDTSALDTSILNGQANVALSYYDNTGVLIGSNLPNPFVVNSSVFITVRATNTITKDPSGPCFTEKQIQFLVDQLPIIPIATPSTFLECDDELDPANQNGIYLFDTSNLESTLLTGQTNMNVIFTKTDGTVITPIPNFNTSSQNIIATVQNPLNTTCIATKKIFFGVCPLPNIPLTVPDSFVCLNLPTSFLTLTPQILDGALPSLYTYSWTKDGVAIPGATSLTLLVNSGGLYTVTVTTNRGCFRTKKETVLSSEIAAITAIDIIDFNDTETNSLLVHVSGIGDYEYSLDQPDGPFQSSPYFAPVDMGIHTVYVNDRKNCGRAQKDVSVFGTPKFFTPNNDGFNDFWNLKGVSQTEGAKSTLYIFDRHGKLLKQISAKSEGWDGTYNGHEMPADDYWFLLQLEDGRTIKGHFALKR